MTEPSERADTIIDRLERWVEIARYGSYGLMMIVDWAALERVLLDARIHFVSAKREPTSGDTTITLDFADAAKAREVFGRLETWLHDIGRADDCTLAISAPSDLGDDNG